MKSRLLFFVLALKLFADAIVWDCVFFCFIFFLFCCFVVCVCDRVVDETEVGLSVFVSGAGRRRGV